MHDDIYLSVVIPAYNEETNIAGTLTEIKEYLGSKGFHYEVIVVDDGSSDMTVARAKESGKSLERLIVIESKPNRGKGYALKKGMLKAQGRLVLFMDADNSTSIKMLDNFTPFFGEEHDIYIASRRLKGATVEVPFERRALGMAYIMFARLILGIKVSDINCGFKIFRREAAHDIFSRQIMNDWSFDAEDLFLAGKKMYRIKEVPVEWEHKYTTKVKPIKDGLKSFASLAMIRGNDMRGKYSNIGKGPVS